MRIVSRKDEDQIQCDRLRGILEAATDGYVTPATSLPQLVSQVEDTMMHFMSRVERLEHSYGNLQMEAATLAAQCSMQEDKLEDLMHIGFDDALEYATLDLMDAFLGSGAASTTFDGDLSFDPNVTFTKQDLKPVLRQAIITWISTKVN